MYALLQELHAVEFRQILQPGLQVVQVMPSEENLSIGHVQVKFTNVNPLMHLVHIVLPIWHYPQLGAQVMHWRLP